MFAYSDAARYRLGTNYQMLPTNKAKAPVYCPFQRDGFMSFGDNYGDDPNYVGSMLKPTYFKVSGNGNRVAPTFTNHEEWAGRVTNFTSKLGPEDFEQATALWRVLGKEPGHQDRFVDNLSSHVAGVKNDKLRGRVYGMFRIIPGIGRASLTTAEMFGKVDTDLGSRLRKATESARANSMQNSS